MNEIPRTDGDRPDPGPLASLWRVLLAPESAFHSLAARPRWVAAFVVLITLGIALAGLITTRMDMEAMFREAAEKQGQTLSESQIEQQVEIAERFGWIGAVVSQAFLQPLIYLLVAAVYLALFRMMGSDIDFRRSLSVTVHGSLPYALSTLLSIPVVLSRDEVTMEEMKSGGFLRSSLATFAPEDAGAATLSLLGSVDLFSIWTIALFALGFRIVGRLGNGVAWGVVLTLWGLYVAGKTALSALW